MYYLKFFTWNSIIHKNNHFKIICYIIIDIYLKYYFFICTIKEKFTYKILYRLKKEKYLFEKSIFHQSC